jgi:CSLREA domain-containing protein
MKTTTTPSRKLIRGAILLLVLTGWFTTPRLFRHWAEPAALAAPMTFFVNNAVDADDGVCSSAISGCTLREAINAANSNPGPDTINFNIPGAGVKTIHLTSNLPFVGAGTLIDGYTQGAATPNTLAVGNDAVLLVELDASHAGYPSTPFSAVGLSLGVGTTVKGLVINGYDSEGIQLYGDSTVEGNFIGTDPTGAMALSQGTGVLILSSNSTVGGTVPAARNLISGNNGAAISIKDSAASGNQVLNNYIGTDTFGTSPVPNGLGVGILGASNNTIGGTLAGSGNLIAFNQSSGVFVAQSATGNNIIGNSIHSNGSLGIDLGVGGITANDTGDGDTGDNNLQNFPVLTSGSSAPANTTVQGTLNSTPNTGFRIEVFSSPSCDQSGNGEGKKLVDSKNVVTNASGDVSFTSLFSTASLDGPYITSTATDPLNNTSEFSKCIPALASTLVVNSTADTDDGACTSSAGGCTLREAINAANSNSLLNAINFNIPGSGVHTIFPTSALPNITGPVIIDGYTQPGASPNALIDGDNAVLLIELNGGAINPVGLALNGGSSVVRGLAINRFEYGITFDSADNVVVGNFVGTNPAGASALGNSQAGIRVNSGSRNRVGALLPADRNVVSGNGGGVVLITTNANVVLGNYIGTNPSGTAALGNNFGLNIAAASFNTVRGNLISGNNTGIKISSSQSHDNIVLTNHIGTDVSLSQSLGNTGAGILIDSDASATRIESSNIIAFNGGAGVSITSGTGNTLADNSIYSNGALGIDLGADGVTPNDGGGDPDSGANNLQNFPVLNSVTPNGNALKVQGTLTSTSFTKYIIRLFSNSSCDPSGNGEGESNVAGKFVTTDLNGSADFSFDLSASFSGSFITATATDLAAGDTSEFSQCKQAPFVSTIQFGTPSMSVVEDCTEVIVNVSRSGDTTLPASVDYSSQSGTASDRTDFTTALGTLHFAPGETAMSFTVLIAEDSFIEGTETATLALSNPVGAGLGNQATATLQITDDQPEQTNNPVDVAEQFVCQHYQDFLNREHDVAGLNFWTNQIESCGADVECRAVKRINVSAAFFLSIEFQETGGDVIRTQRAAFGKKSDTAATRLTYLQFLRDARQVGNSVVVGEPTWQQKLEDNKQAYAEQIVTSAQFIAQYPLNQSADTFVDALFASAGVVPLASERQDAINAFGAGGTAGRSAALRSVADSQTLRAAEFRPAFVLMQYFGYLRRNPTDAPDNNDNGYQFWLAKLNSFNGDFAKAEMVKAFIISIEYRSRFGQP